MKVLVITALLATLFTLGGTVATAGKIPCHKASFCDGKIWCLVCPT